MNLINEAFDAENFRQLGHQLIDFLADEMLADDNETDGVLAWQEPAAALEHWKNDFNRGKQPSTFDFYKKAVQQSIRLRHPKYMGHQISPTASVAVLAGLVGEYINNGMGVYEMGIVGSTLDRVVVRQAAEQLGFSEQADGILTSGGTLANLTALLTARATKAREQVWKEGTRQRYALMVSAQAHYCVDRAARIMGWGEEGIIKIPVNEQYAMQTELLEEYYQAAQNKGIQILAVVGSACSTSTGTFDDLEAIAAFSQKYNLWFHVDGAHGAALAYANKYKHLVKGIHLADSVTMDFHKMLLTPSVTTALLFKQGTENFKTFAQEAQYLFEEQEGYDWNNMAKRTFECTKLSLSLRIYSILRTHGLELFDEYVTKVIDTTHLMAELIKVDPDFELAAQPESNIICFRHRPADLALDQLNTHNEQIRSSIRDKGEYYIVKTSLQGQTFLRCTFTNPFTEKEHLKGLLEVIKQEAGR